MQFAQDVVRNVALGARLAVQENRNLRILAANFHYESTQFGQGFFRLERQLLVVDLQDEGGGPTLLLGKRSQITIAGHPQHFEPFFLNRFRQGTDAKPGSILGAKIFINDDDRKVKAHAIPLKGGDPPRRVEYG